LVVFYGLLELGMVSLGRLCLCWCVFCSCWGGTTFSC